jgi:LacI family transcriptional regulator
LRAGIAFANTVSYHDAMVGIGRVTIKDVARVAGVSHGTVSKALNDSTEVSEDTRRRVAAAAERLGYRPNAIARSLKNRRTHTIGLVTNDSDGIFSTAMARGVAELASERGFGVFVCNSFGSVAKERQHLELLLDKQVDAIILVGYKVAERGAPAAPTGQTPVLYLYEYTRSTDSPCVLPDDRGGAQLATVHLLDLGRRRIAYINGPPTFEATQDRLRGHRDALAAHGIEFDPSLLRTSPDWNQDSGFAHAQDLMRSNTPPDGIVCANDELAAGAILGLRELAAAVPADVSVVGFDDRPFAAHLPIPLTTVALPLHEMGMLAAARVFEALDGADLRHELERVPCRLVVRASCGGLEPVGSPIGGNREPADRPWR